MALDEELRQLAAEVPPPPPGDPRAAFHRGRRRRRTRHLAAVLGAASLVTVVTVGIVGALEGEPRSPEITGRPDATGDDPATGDWVTLRAGDLEVSVPPSWQVHTVTAPPATATHGGPCASDLYGWQLPVEGDAPFAVVYPMETDGACRAVGLPDAPPAHPSLVLYAELRGSAGTDPSDDARTERVGDVDLLRLDGEDEHVVWFRQLDGPGGLLVARPDDPVVEQVLATLRSVPPEATDQPDADALDTDAVCPAPALRPTTLPWLEPGTAVPEPTHVHEGTADDPHGRVVWAEDPGRFDPDGTSDTHTVTIASLPSYEAGLLGALPEVEVRGHAADLLWVGFGNLGVTWSEGRDACEAYALHLALSPTDGEIAFLDLGPPPDDGDDIGPVEAALEAALLRVAGSLTYEPS